MNTNEATGTLSNILNLLYSLELLSLPQRVCSELSKWRWIIATGKWRERRWAERTNASDGYFHIPPFLQVLIRRRCWYCLLFFFFFFHLPEVRLTLWRTLQISKSLEDKVSCSSLIRNGYYRSGQDLRMCGHVVQHVTSNVVQKCRMFSELYHFRSWCVLMANKWVPRKYSIFMPYS